MRTLRVYPLTFPSSPTAMLAVVLKLYMMSLTLTYLITGSLYLATTFLQLSKLVIIMYALSILSPTNQTPLPEEPFLTVSKLL